MLAERLQMDESVAVDLSGRSLVLGLGATGLAAVRFIAARGHEVAVADSRPHPPMRDALARLGINVEILAGGFDTRALAGVARVVVSPGIALDTPIVARAFELGLPVLSDIELFAQSAAAPIVAVTGSNGKSTVTSLVSHLLQAHGLAAPAGGNLGPPALELLDAGHVDAYVLEVSSFQMETTQSLRPFAAAVLNVSPDHLDRHGTIERYAGLKEKLLAAAARAIVNIDDPLVRAMGESHAHAIACSIETQLDKGYSLVARDGTPWLARDGDALVAANALTMTGRHNWFNGLAALALAEQIAGPDGALLDALCRFEGLPHRCRRVGERRGVVYVDDSKATNVAATVAALAGLDAPIVLIGGGIGKGADFSELAEAARGRVKAAFLIGEAAAELARTLSPVCTASIAPSLEEAVGRAAELARPGDTVLLSPACSSLDMFRDYAERGDAFAAAVRELGT